MADSTLAPTSGFRVTYASLAELQEDHDTYLAHGGLMIPWSDNPPEPNTLAMVRIETPLERTFNLPGRVVQLVPGQGFLVAFESRADAERAGLTRLLASDAFHEAKAMEAEASEPPPEKKEVDAFRPDAPPPPPRLKRKPKYLQLKLADPNALPEGLLDEAPAEADDGFTEERTPVEESPPAAVPTKYGAASAGGERPAELPFRTPEPGETYGVYVAKFPCLLDYADLAPTFLTSQLITLPFEQEVEAIQSASSAKRNPSRRVGDPAKLRIQVPVKQTFEMWTIVAAVTPTHVTLWAQETDPAFNNVCAYPATINGRKRLGVESDGDRVGVEVYKFNEERNVEEDERADVPIRLQLARMSMEEKINLALSGGREARMALAQDPNKAIPHYLLRNARISLDEIAFIARLANMNPDVLKKIAENPQYVQSPQVVRNLVFNPKTPIDVAVRLLDRLAKNDLIQLSKRTSANMRLTMKAKQKLSGSKH